MSDNMKEPETIEEELEIIAAALEAGIDPFPPRKEPKPCLLYTSPSPRDRSLSRMPSSA